MSDVDDFGRKIESAKPYYEALRPAVRAFVEELGLEYDEFYEGDSPLVYLCKAPAVRFGTDLDAFSPRTISRAVYLEFVLEPEPGLIISVEVEQAVDHKGCASLQKWMFIQGIALAHILSMRDPEVFLRSRLDIAWRVVNTITHDDLLDTHACVEDINRLQNAMQSNFRKDQPA